jgi:hypothetical protein
MPDNYEYTKCEVNIPTIGMPVYVNDNGTLKIVYVNDGGVNKIVFANAPDKVRYVYAKCALTPPSPKTRYEYAKCSS